MCKILNLKIKWKGTGVNTKGFDKNGNCIIECNKRYFRPTEVDLLLGDASKAKKKIKMEAKNII